jgi:hypothetical protein
MSYDNETLVLYYDGTVEPRVFDTPACPTTGCGRDTAPGFSRCLPGQVAYAAWYHCSEGQEKTLRDEFAMAAPTELLLLDDYRPEIAAQRAYEYADAMLAARERKP